MDELIKKYSKYVTNLESNLDVMTTSTRDVAKHKIAAYNEIITDLENMRKGKETPDEISNCIKPAVSNNEVAVCDHTHGFYFDEKGIITCVRCHPPKEKQTDC